MYIVSMSLARNWVSLLKELEGWDWDAFPPRLMTGISKEGYQEAALNYLKYSTGQDFGYDVKAWEAWLEEHPNIIEEREASGELPPFDEERFGLS